MKSKLTFAENIEKALLHERDERERVRTVTCESCRLEATVVVKRWDRADWDKPLKPSPKWWCYFHDADLLPPLEISAEEEATFALPLVVRFRIPSASTETHIRCDECFQHVDRKIVEEIAHMFYPALGQNPTENPFDRYASNPAKPRPVR